MNEDIQVTFKAILVEDGNGPFDIRVLIPRGKYLLVAQDDGYYYFQPADALMSHQEKA